MTLKRPQHRPGRHRKPSTTLIQKLAQSLQPKPKPPSPDNAETVLLPRIT